MMTILIFGAPVRPDGTPGTALRRRVEAAIQCARDHPDALFIPTGAVGQRGPSEASVMAALLMRSGVRNDRILLEETGSDTLSSARAVTRLLRGRPPGPVVVATSGYHLPRCLTVLWLLGVAASPCAPPAEPSRSWRTRWYWRLREVPALPYDAAIALYLRLAGRP